MSRTVSSAALQAFYASETDEPFLVLVTISHPALPNPLRVTSDTVPTLSRGETYTSFAFAVQLPGDEEEAPPLGRLAIDNVSKDATDKIRSVSTPALVTMEVVRGKLPDEVLATFPNYKLRNVQGVAAQVTGDLELDDLVREAYPGRSFTVTAFPGLVA